MEEIAERSYDAMEAYLLIQEKASKKLGEEAQKVDAVYKLFAAKQNVKLIASGPSKLEKKLVQASEANAYANKIFLVQFKSTVQEGAMVESLAKKDVNAAEQARNSMVKYAEEGLNKLDTIAAFKGDGQLLVACRKVLTYQLTEAKEVDKLYELVLHEKEFEKLRQSFEAKPASSRTQKDVDAYNGAVDAYNKKITEHNNLNQKLFTQRNATHSQFGSVQQRFMQMHVPK